MRKTLPLLVLLLSAASFAQTYTVVPPYAGGRYASPYQFHAIQLSGSQQISWFSPNDYNSCAGQTTAHHGFVFTSVANQGQCIPLNAGESTTSASFDSVDNSGNPVHGEIELTLYLYKCGNGGGRGGGYPGTCYQITGGTLTLTH